MRVRGPGAVGFLQIKPVVIEDVNTYRTHYIRGDRLSEEVRRDLQAVSGNLLHGRLDDRLGLRHDVALRTLRQAHGDPG